jgi:hypothetical protein
MSYKSLIAARASIKLFIVYKNALYFYLDRITDLTFIKDLLIVFNLSKLYSCYSSSSSLLTIS